MLPDRVSNPGPLTYESGALPIVLRGLAFMIGKNIGAAAATPAAPVPTPMQFYAVFQSLSCRRHVDNSCSSLVQECRLQHRRGATMLANKPPGII